MDSTINFKILHSNNHNHLEDVHFDDVQFESDFEKFKKIELSSYKQLHSLFLINFNKIEYSDLIITVNDKVKYYVNKFMLASLSDIFNKMFFDSNWCKKESENVNGEDHFINSINLNEEAECEQVFEKYN
jgi:hypothetical protein